MQQANNTWLTFPDFKKQSISKHPKQIHSSLLVFPNPPKSSTILKENKNFRCKKRIEKKQTNIKKNKLSLTIFQSLWRTKQFHDTGNIMKLRVYKKVVIRNRQLCFEVQYHFFNLLYSLSYLWSLSYINYPLLIESTYK